MKCKDCEYFHIIQEPLRGTGGLVDMGKVECKKYNKVIDFANNGKLNKLECMDADFISQEDIDTAINMEFDYITKYDKYVTPVYTDSAMIKILKQVRSDILAFKEDAEIRYGHQLGFDKIYAYERCLNVIDTKIKELEV